MKIAMAIKGLERSAGGAERVFSDIAGGLAARGHAITAISYDRPDSEPFFPLDPRVEWIRLGIGRTEKPAGLAETVARIFAVRRVVQGLNPEIVVGFMHSTFVPLGVALLGTGIPMVASEHNAFGNYRRHPIQRALLRLTPSLARRITVVSVQAMAEFPPSLRKTMVVIPNPIRPIAPSRADVVATNRPHKTLLSVGRLNEEKDFFTLISAFSKIAPRFPDWDLRIVGEGQLRDQIEKRILDLGLDGRICLPGLIKDIDREYESAQLFVLPSRHESLGLVVAEALAHGLPAVGFADCPGVNTLIRPGRNGVLVSGADRVAALGEALARLMARGELRKALVPAAAEFPAEFGSEGVLDRWEELLNRSR